MPPKQGNPNAIAKKTSTERGRKRKVPHQDKPRSSSSSRDDPSPSEATQSNSGEGGRKVAALPRRPSDQTTSIIVPDDAAADSPLRALRNFFETELPTLKKGKGHTESTSTRTPGIFDRHLEKILRLKRVVRLPAIEEDLKSVAAQAVHAFPVQRFPPLDEAFPSERTMSQVLRDIQDTIIQKEDHIQDIYSGIARQCARVAGTLAYSDSKGTWESRLLRWTTSPMATKKKSSIAQNQATPDGVLNFLDVLKKSKKFKARHLIAKYGLQVLVLAEFKNLNFCDDEHLLRVVTQFCGGEFPWATCEDGFECNHKTKPNVQIVGRDAANHPCPSMKDAREQFKAEEALPRVATFYDGARDILQQAWASAVRYDATFIIIHAGNSEIIAIRDRETQTFYLSDVIHVNTCPNYLQMHVGLYIAAIRDAEDRALARSSQKDNPPTWNPLREDNIELDWSKKSHTNFTAELLKAASSRQWLSITPDKKSSYHPFTQELYRRVKGPEDIILRRSPSPRESPAPSQASQEYLSVTLENLYDLVRSSSSCAKHEFSVERYGFGAVNPTPNTRFELQDLDEPSFSGHRICRAVLRFNDIKKPRSFPLAKFPALVIKNATEPHHIACLQEEYRVIEDLRQKNVPHVPQIYGLFRCPDADDPDKQFIALVLEDLGTSLADRKTGKKRAKVSIPSEDAAQIMDILESWHRAGYIHCNLSKKRLVVLFEEGSSTKRFSIVGFRHAESIVALDSVARQMKIDENKELMRRVLGQR